MTIIPIVDQISEVVASMRNLSAKDAAKFGVDQSLVSPFYFYGSPVEMNRQMIEMDKGSTRGKVYPAVALRLPIDEDVKNGLVNYKLNIAILAQTKMQYNAPNRYEFVMKPILYPLYLLLISRLKRYGFTWDGDMEYPPHTKRDMLHHGVEATQGNVAYIFNQPLDAIELINLRLNNKIKHC